MKGEDEILDIKRKIYVKYIIGTLKNALTETVDRNIDRT